MRELLESMQCVDNFTDDVVIYTSRFQEHLSVVREFLQRLRATNLTVDPRKCFIGYRSLMCLGHITGDEKLRPKPEKVTAVQNFNRSSTKKQVRSFIGMVGFYRKFISNFSAISTPLTDLTRKGQSNKVVWADPQEN